MKIKSLNNRKIGVLNLASLIMNYIWIFIYSLAVSNTHESFHKLGESIYSIILNILLILFLLMVSFVNFSIAREYKKNQQKKLSKIYTINSLMLFFIATKGIIFRLLILLRNVIDNMLGKNGTIISFDTVLDFVNAIATIFYIIICILNIILIIKKTDDKKLDKSKIAKKIKKIGILCIIITIFVSGTFIYSKVYLNNESVI